MGVFTTDPIRLGAEARAVIVKLHERGDVVVRFKTNQSGYTEDELDELDKKAPGHFKPDQILLTLNLDELVTRGKPMPTSLATIEDFRRYPVLTGVTAHESAHARFSLWGTKLGSPFPKEIPNPDYDPADPESGPEVFPVSRNSKLESVALLLEEPRVERLGMKHFTKTWRRSMGFSASHFVLERINADDTNGTEALDAAMNLAILVGGRQSAGTLGQTYESRKAVKTVLDSAQAIIETALPDVDDPFHKLMGLVNKATFDNNHTDAIPHLEYARQILKLIHPEEQENPDEGGGAGEGDEESEGGAAMPGAGESAEGDDEAAAAAAAAMQEALDELKAAMNDAVAKLDDGVKKEVRQEEKQPDSAFGGGEGAVITRDPQAPAESHKEKPTDADRALYRKAAAWMERQIQPTVVSDEYSQWLPSGGARLNVRNHIRDNIGERFATQRSDWDRVSETVKPAPPVKVATMLDGSGSMQSLARVSAGIGWATANAAADLPESRTASVVFGPRAAITQKPGHAAPREVSVSMTNGGWENFIHAAALVSEALWLDDEVEEGEQSNVLIIIVSDLQYNGGNQADEFLRITREWAERGYNILVVGAVPTRRMPNGVPISSIDHITIVSIDDLFS